MHFNICTIFIVLLFYFCLYQVKGNGLQVGGENVCSQNVTMTVTKVVTYTRWRIRNHYWCARWVYREFGYCPRELAFFFRTRRRVTATRIVHSRKEIQISVCCDGYRRQGDSCPIAICDGGCLNGRCTSPNNCTCNHGYTGMNCKEDVDECVVNNGGCEQLCINQLGSRSCACLNGYQISPFFPDRCDDLNECELSSGLCECVGTNNGCNAVCQNIPGSYVCNCSKGFFTDNNRHCHDINECHHSNGKCSYLCENYDGGYKCICPFGFTLGEDNKTCIDINECQTRNGGCSYECLNTNGSFICRCPNGYVLDSNGKTCSDHDECKNTNHGCEQLCENYQGSFACGCNKGFKLNPDNTTCSDIDECNELVTINHGDAGITSVKISGCTQRCNNTIGSFNCYCNEGYLLYSDGKTCLDIDECAENETNLCENLCFNMDGSYSCSCNKGYITGERFYECVGEPCGNLSPVQNGNASCLSGVTGDRCTFKCDEGFTLIGSAERWCEPNHKWNGTTPRCQRNRCPLLDPPDNGMLIMPCTPYFNSTCKVGCVNGYVLNGAIDERRCLVGADGQMEWNNNNIQCLESGVCTPNPCNNSGICTIKNNKARCFCRNTGYTGDYCEIGIITVGQPPILEINGTTNITISARPDNQLRLSISSSNPGLKVTPEIVEIISPNRSAEFNLQATKAGLYTLKFTTSGNNLFKFNAPKNVFVFVTPSNGDNITTDSPLTCDGLLRPGCYAESELGRVSNNLFNTSVGIIQFPDTFINGTYIPLSINGEAIPSVTTSSIGAKTIGCFSGNDSSQYVSEIIENNAFAFTVFDVFNKLSPSWIKMTVALTLDKFLTTEFRGEYKTGEYIMNTECGKPITVKSSGRYIVYTTRQEIRILTPGYSDVIPEGTTKCIVRGIDVNEIYVTFTDDTIDLDNSQLDSVKEVLSYDGSIDSIGILKSAGAQLFTSGERKLPITATPDVTISGSVKGKHVWETKLPDNPFTMSEGNLNMLVFIITPNIPLAMSFKGEIRNVRWSSLPSSNNTCYQGSNFRASIKPSEARILPNLITFDKGDALLDLNVVYPPITQDDKYIVHTISFRPITLSSGPYSDCLTKLNETLTSIIETQKSISTKQEVLQLRDLVVKAQRSASVLLNKKHPVLNDAAIRETLDNIVSFNISKVFNVLKTGEKQSNVRLFQVKGNGSLCISQNYCIRTKNDLYYGELTSFCLSETYSNNSIVVRSNALWEDNLGGLLKLSPENPIVTSTDPYQTRGLTNWTFYGEVLQQSELVVIYNRELQVRGVSMNNEIGEIIELSVTSQLVGISKSDSIVFNIKGNIAANGSLEKQIKQRLAEEITAISRLVQIREELTQKSIEDSRKRTEAKTVLFESKQNEIEIIKLKLNEVGQNITIVNRKLNEAREKIRNVTLEKSEIEKYLNMCSTENCESKKCIPGTVVDICQEDETKLETRKTCKMVPKQFQKMALEKRVEQDFNLTFERTRVCYNSCPFEFGFSGYFRFFWRPNWKVSYFLQCSYRYIPVVTITNVTITENNLVNYTLNVSVCDPNTVVSVRLSGGRATECRKSSTCATFTDNSNCSLRLKRCNKFRQQLATLQSDMQYVNSLDEIKQASMELELLSLSKRVLERRLKNSEQITNVARTQAILANSSLSKAQTDRESLRKDSKYIKMVIREYLQNKKTVDIKNISFQFDYMYGMQYPRRLLLRISLENEISSTQEIASLLDLDNKRDSITEITNEIFSRLTADLKASSTSRKRRSVSSHTVNLYRTIQQQLHETCVEVATANDFLTSFLTNLAKELYRYEKLQNDTSLVSNERMNYIKELEARYVDVLDVKPMTEQIYVQMREEQKIPSWNEVHDTFILKSDVIIRSENVNCYNLQDCIFYHVSIIRKHFQTNLTFTTADIDRWEKNLLRLSEGNLILNDTEHIIEDTAGLTHSNMTQTFCRGPPTINNNDHKVINYKNGDLVKLEFRTTGDEFPIEVLWRYNGKIINGEYESTLKLPAIKQHAGLYTCEVSNRFGTTSCGSWYVNVYGKPKLSQHPESTVTYKRSPEEQYISCIATDSTELTWKFQSFKSAKTETLEGGNSTFRLTDQHKSGYYWCEVSNVFYTTRSSRAIVQILESSVSTPQLQIHTKITHLLNTRRKRSTEAISMSIQTQLSTILNSSITDVTYSNDFIEFVVSGKDFSDKLNKVNSWDDLTYSLMQERERIMNEVGKFYNSAKSSLIIMIGNKYYKPNAESILIKQRSLHCPIGKVLLRNGFICGDCPSGTYHASGKCIACPKNSYQSNTGQSNCIRCPSNTFTKEMSSLSSTACISAKKTQVDEKSKEENSNTVLAIVVVVAIVLLILAIVAFVVWKKRTENRKNLSESTNDNHISSCVNPVYSIEDEYNHYSRIHEGQQRKITLDQQQNLSSIQDLSSNLKFKSKFTD